MKLLQLAPWQRSTCVTVPALPLYQSGCDPRGGLGDDPEAIEVYLESLEAYGDPIPGPIEIERVTVSA